LLQDHGLGVKLRADGAHTKFLYRRSKERNIHIRGSADESFNDRNVRPLIIRNMAAQEGGDCRVCFDAHNSSLWTPGGNSEGEHADIGADIKIRACMAQRAKDRLQRIRFLDAEREQAERHRLSPTG
jgi:hypothetical protein